MSQRKRCLDRADNVAGQEPEAEADALGLLTRRERDIVALAVRGLSDRQIAAELQVSIRTVEGHLYRSYAKLNVKGRDQLPGVLAACLSLRAGMAHSLCRPGVRSGGAGK